jgi:excisionase family DNA binding protein
MSEAGKRLATVKEACAYAKMGKSKLYQKINTGEIKAYRREGQTLVDLDSIDAMNERECIPWVLRATAGGTRGGT